MTAGEKVPQWVRSQVKRSNSGGILYNAVRIDTGAECDEEPSYDCEAIDRRVAQLNGAGEKVRHEQRVVQHVSGTREYMPMCVCGQTWPCPAAGEKVPTLREAIASCVYASCRMEDAAELMDEYDALQQRAAQLEAREKVLREALEKVNGVLTDSRRSNHESVRVAIGIVGNALAALAAGGAQHE